MSMDSSQTRLDHLLNRYKSGQASPQEKEELSVLLQQDWDQMTSEGSADHIDWKRMLTSIKKEASVRRIHPFRTIWFRAAAAVLLLAGAGTLSYVYRTRPANTQEAFRRAAPVEIGPGQNKAILTLSGGRQIMLDSTNSDTVLTEGNDIIASAKGTVAYNAGSSTDDTGAVYNTLSTPRGGQYKLTLPDGTKVWLNAASSIQYPTSFNGPERTVTVTGETYFEVVQKVNQPFIVRSGKMAVRVLGTSFNINAYADEPGIKTSLIEGSVKVSQGNKETRLLPGQQARLDATDIIEVTKLSNPLSAIAWKNGYFSFEKADIPTVMRQLSRWYDIDVSYQGGSAPLDFFWGDLKRNANLSDIFAVLAKSGIYFTTNGNKVLVLNKH
jgi:transmembrane sensor